MSDEVTKAREAVLAAVRKHGKWGTAGTTGAAVVALDALVLAARADEWAARKGPALLAVAEAAERYYAAVGNHFEQNGLDDICVLDEEAAREMRRAGTALRASLASLTRNDEASRG